MTCGKAMSIELQSRVHLTLLESSSFFMNEGARVALLLADINKIMLHDTTIYQSYGYGLLIANSRWITISNSKISYSNFGALECYTQNSLKLMCHVVKNYRQSIAAGEVTLHAMEGISWS